MELGLLSLGDLLDDPVTGHRQICMFDLGGMPLTDVLTSIELLGAEVLPQIRAGMTAP